MPFSDYSATPAANTTLGDDIFIGPNMERGKVRPALQQIAADGRILNDIVQEKLDLAKGDPGAAGNVAASLGQLKAAATTNVTMIYNGTPFNWTLGDYTGQADDINVVQANGTPLSTGAWVRQKASQISAADGQTVQQALDTLSGSVEPLTTQQSLSIDRRSFDEAVGASQFTPRGLFGPGIQGVWLDIQDLSTMFSDTSATTLAAIDGKVALIKDKSGNGNNFVQADVGAQPTLRFDSTNKRYYLEFATASLSVAFAQSEAFERVSCIEVTTWQADDYIFGSGNGTAAGILFMAPATNQIRMFNGLNGPTATIVPGQLFTITEHYYAGASHVQINNGLRITGSVGLANPGGITIGDAPTGGAQSAMRLYGLVHIDRILTERERGLVRAAVTPSRTTLILKGAALGDSTVASFEGRPGLDEYLPDFDCNNLAVPGQNIAQQKAIWVALSAPAKADLKVVIIQLGLNNIQTTTAADMIAQLQDLVDTVRADVPAECKIYISKMSPARGAWYGLPGGVGPELQARQEEVNSAIAGLHPTPITGVDGRITAHYANMSDSLGNLLSDFETDGDGIHPNYWGLQVAALSGWRAALVADGLLKG